MGRGTAEGNDALVHDQNYLEEGPETALRPDAPHAATNPGTTAHRGQAFRRSGLVFRGRDTVQQARLTRVAGLVRDFWRCIRRGGRLFHGAIGVATQGGD